MAPRTVRAAVLAATLVGSQAMSIEQVPSGLRLRGGVDLGKIAQSITGVFNKDAKVESSPSAAPAASGDVRLKGGGAVMQMEL
jgi:hypothetical protein